MNPSKYNFEGFFLILYPKFCQDIFQQTPFGY